MEERMRLVAHGATVSRGPVLLLAAIIAALTIATAAPASAASYVAKAWGANSSGQLGNGTTEGPEKCEATEGCSTVPVDVSKLSGVTAVTGGGRHSIALLESGKVMAWGNNTEGRLGNGTETNSSVPVEVSGLSEVTAIAAGEAFNLALLKNGKVMAWGSNSFATLGNGDETRKNSKVPVEVVGLSEPVKAIAAGEDHALAVLASGKVMAWGYGGGGALGNGEEHTSTVPVAVCAVGTVGPCPSGPYLSNIAAVAGGGGGREHSLALLESGNVVAWGGNSNGQLGNGTENSTNVPVEVSGLSEVAAIAAGNPFSVALLKNGEVKAWGRNEKGELGQGVKPGPEVCGTSGSCSKSPLKVSGLSGVTTIAAGSQGFVVALLANGTVKAWGASGWGQLGNGSSTGPEVCGVFAAPCSNTPVAVSKIVGAKGIGAGYKHGLAFGPPPTVTKIVPKTGPAGGGTTVTITGTDLNGASAVKFGSISASSFTVNSATTITAVSPAELAGSVDVTVTTAWGTSATSLADRFKFVPTVTGLSPATGSSAGGSSVTVAGTGFATGVAATKFKFGSTPASSVNCTSTTSCTVVAPAHAVGTVDVKATVNKVSSPRSRPADQFTYN
jgi:alpha-tubulin suppressor-like RCC1 family protein